MFEFDPEWFKPNLLLLLNSDCLFKELNLIISDTCYNIKSRTADGFIDNEFSDINIIITDISELDVISKLCRFNRKVIVLKRNVNVSDIVSYLDNGAVDVLSLPFDNEEILAKLRVLNRSLTLELSVILDEFNKLNLHRKEKKAVLNGISIHLTTIEFELLLYLVLKRNKVCTRSEIMNFVWRKDIKKLTTRTIDTHISQLRKKLGYRYFINIHAVGYLFRTFELY
ncbi:response regulator transcription factor [Vibrio sp. ArtGut-C1]|uniref:response regulator transcription factor n=1 Tax=Vibrio sp. ArtGut-C1 TaxID=2259137 RepID=UPI000A18CBEB|nr:response regulator transcription factor [Vibrio sp. ArtGut-C1]